MVSSPCMTGGKSNRVVHTLILVRDQRHQVFMQQTASGVRCGRAASHLVGRASYGAQRLSWQAAPAVRLCWSEVPAMRQGRGPGSMSQSSAEQERSGSRRSPSPAPRGGPCVEACCRTPPMRCALCPAGTQNRYHACAAATLHACMDAIEVLGNRSTHRCRTSLIGKDDVLPLKRACGSPCCAPPALLWLWESSKLILTEFGLWIKH